MATKGYIEYTEKFGSDFSEWKTLPWQVMPAYGAYWPMTLEDDELIGELLMQCASENKKSTAKQVVDAMYLFDGIYTSEEHNVKAETYDDFLQKMSRLNFRV